MVVLVATRAEIEAKNNSTAAMSSYDKERESHVSRKEVITLINKQITKNEK